MKIVAINGSPKGKSSCTNVMLSSILKVAAKQGADTINIFYLKAILISAKFVIPAGLLIRKYAFKKTIW